MSFEKKYLKYKEKYLNLKTMIGHMDLIAASGKGGGGWKCHECGYLNNDDAKKCEICEVDRPRKQKGWYCETCDLLNSAEAEICAACASVHKVLHFTEADRAQIARFLRELYESDAKYLKGNNDFKAVATPYSSSYIPGQEPAIGTIHWFQHRWIELSENSKKIIRERYNNNYKFNVSISPDIHRGNIVVFYLVEPLTHIALKYGHSLEKALEILHNFDIGGLPENHEFIKEAFNDKFMSEKK